MNTLDQVIENSVKMGKFQYIVLLIISMIDFADGIEKTLIGTLQSILKTQWNLNDLDISLMTSSYFIGIVSGTLLCAFYADQIGRAKTLLYSSLLAFLLLLWHSFAQSFQEILILRFCFGVIFGTTIPLGHVVISEIVPAKIRGQVMTIVATVFIVGKIYCTGLQMIFLDDYKSGNWRMLLIVNSIPLLLCFICSLIYLRESPRYYFTKQNYDQGFLELEHIGKVNNGTSYQLADEQRQGILEQQQQINQEQEPIKTVRYLFSKQYIKFTLRIWIVFMLTSIIETTLYYLMPFWLGDSQKGFMAQMYMMLAELMAGIVVYFIIDSKKTGGRSKLVLLLSVLIFITSVILIIFEDSFLVYGLTLISFLLKVMFTAEMVIMNENYTTQYRSMGVGMTQTVGKFMGVISPYFIYPMYSDNPYSPFYLYASSMVVLAILSATLPFDMTQVELDNMEVYKQKQNKKSLVNNQ
ncbi:unnamed protein product [Paramecium pentaurelia]|uniref:Major facilitator superfamily (MFS) profile domain-containing protein n=1 Tax=Paramecium pentaurelia TaxID=43138 RepID=A0A8S1WVL7_9CILI|nr:unnamed protein product [Paramecium pentaurelia]